MTATGDERGATAARSSRTNPPDACGLDCVDFQNDVAHCGDCITVCAGGAVCLAGACGCPATAPEVCGTDCADFASDNDHCGDCITACGVGATCVAGICTP